MLDYKEKYDIKKLLMIFIAIILFGQINVFAKGNIEVKNVSIQDKSDTIVVEDLKYENNTISSKIAFNKLDDFVTLNIEVINNGKTDYIMDSINNNIHNDFISIESGNISKTVKKGSTENIKVTIKYNNELLEGEDIVLNDASLGLVFREPMVNPTTSRKIVIILLVVVLAIGITFYSVKSKKKALLLLLAILPAFTFALEETKIKLEFKDITIKKIDVKMNLNPEYFFMTADESMEVLVEILREWGRTEEEIQTDHIDDREGYTDEQILERFLEDFHTIGEADMYDQFEKYKETKSESEQEAIEEKFYEMNEKWDDLMNYLEDIAEERGNEGLQDQEVRNHALAMGEGLYEYFDEIGLLDQQYGYSFISVHPGSYYIDYGYEVTATGQTIDPNKNYYLNGYGDILETKPNPHTYRMHFIRYQ